MRRNPNKHAKKKNAQSINIYHPAVCRIPPKQFQGNESQRPTKGMCPFQARHMFLAQSEICENSMVVAIDQHILRLQISIQNITRMQMNKSQKNLSGIKLRQWIL